MAVQHPKYGSLVPSRKKYKRLGNKMIQLYTDKNGIERELDGSESEMTPQGVNPELMKQIDDRKKEESHAQLMQGMDELKKAIENQTKNDKESILGTLEAIKDKDFPKPIDFTAKLDEISKKISKLDEKSYYNELESVREAVLSLNKDPKDYTDELSKIEKAVNSIKPVDLTTVLVLLREIADKKYPEFPTIPAFPKKIEAEDKKLIKFFSELIEDGKLKVSVDKVGGGGGGVWNPVIRGEVSTDTYKSLKIDSDGHLQVDIQEYKITDLATGYYGYTKADGGWYIMQLTDTTARYVKGDSDYATAWSGKEGLSYDYYFNTF